MRPFNFVVAVFFLLAFISSSLPYAYYNALRLIGIGCFAAIVYFQGKSQPQNSLISLFKYSVMAISITAIILLQPIYKIPMGREIWQIIDLNLAIFIALYELVRGSIENKFKAELAFVPAMPQEPSIKEIDNKTKDEKEQNLDNKQKGEEFEDYVAKQITSQNIKQKDRRSDKGNYNIGFPESNQYPDFEFELSYKEKKICFAVECKWRNNLIGNKIDITDERLNRYKKFSRERKIPVFLVLGVGGEPYFPSELYCANIDNIAIGQIAINCMQKLDPKRKLYYLFKEQKLLNESIYNQRQYC